MTGLRLGPLVAVMLGAQLHPSRVVAGAADFAGRYGFLRRPGYVRF